MTKESRINIFYVKLLMRQSFNFGLTLKGAIPNIDKKIYF